MWGKKYSWYERFSTQIATGWSLDFACFNEETNQVAYLKHRQVGGRASILDSQLGVYSIVLDAFDKASVVRLGYFESCGLPAFEQGAPFRWEGESISYFCRGGDAGHGSERVLRYDVLSKQTNTIKTCIITPDEQTCDDSPSVSPVPAQAWQVIPLGAGISMHIPSDWKPPVLTADPPLDIYELSAQSIGHSGFGPTYSGACEGASCQRHKVTVYGVMEPAAARRELQGSTGDVFSIREGTLNGSPVIVYGLGGNCSGNVALVFGPTATVRVEAYCVSAQDTETWAQIVETVRLGTRHYLDPDSGISFDYPAAWSVKKEGNVIFIGNRVQNPDNINIDPRFLDIQVLAETNTALPGLEGSRAVRFGNIRGEEITYASDFDGSPVRDVALQVSERAVVGLNMYGAFDENRAAIDSMLSTFRVGQ